MTTHETNYYHVKTTVNCTITTPGFPTFERPKNGPSTIGGFKVENQAGNLLRQFNGFFSRETMHSAGQKTEEGK